NFAWRTPYELSIHRRNWCSCYGTHPPFKRFTEARLTKSITGRVSSRFEIFQQSPRRVPSRLRGGALFEVLVQSLRHLEMMLEIRKRFPRQPKMSACVPRGNGPCDP